MSHRNIMKFFQCNFLLTKKNVLKVIFNNLQFIKHVIDTFGNIFLVREFFVVIFRLFKSSSNTAVGEG